MEMLCSQSLTVTEVSSYPNILGAEVSDYVAKTFTGILTNQSAYKKKDYVKALNEAFREMDEAIDSPEGAK